jgi:hypothetical protein
MALPRATRALCSAKLPEDWDRATAADGKEYYYNKITRETQWEMPSNKSIYGSIVEATEADSTTIFESKRPVLEIVFVCVPHLRYLRLRFH